MLRILFAIGSLLVAAGCTETTDSDTTAQRRTDVLMCHQDHLAECLASHDLKKDADKGFGRCVSWHCSGGGNATQGHTCSFEGLRKCVVQGQGGGGCAKPAGRVCGAVGLAYARDGLDQTTAAMRADLMKAVKDLEQRNEARARAAYTAAQSVADRAQSTLEDIQASGRAWDKATKEQFVRDLNEAKRIMTASKILLDQFRGNTTRAYGQAITCHEGLLRSCSAARVGGDGTYCLKYCQGGSDYKPGDDATCKRDLLVTCNSAKVRGGGACVSDRNRADCW